MLGYEYYYCLVCLVKNQVSIFFGLDHLLFVLNQIHAYDVRELSPFISE